MVDLPSIFMGMTVWSQTVRIAGAPSLRPLDTPQHVVLRYIGTATRCGFLKQTLDKV